ncbi:twin-arginine translocase TatA/TatE family subunit [bacterium]|nr:twin-arginine translocase TatA/TatE family subunit [bacterium]MBU1152594.1 twin-arginine translocase TatA/TatE family subunit [bacterium]MBU1782201.1 twin-arginine translocase TatA/TatE family subunit [bacterium]MBU2600286.1 twin-arginine translocase TatA/TatE family subunit [bacterium]
MFNLGMPELLIILAIALVIFGANKLSGIGSSLGKGIREFKRGIKDIEEEVKPDSKD